MLGFTHNGFVQRAHITNRFLYLANAKMASKLFNSPNLSAFQHSRACLSNSRRRRLNACPVDIPSWSAWGEWTSQVLRISFPGTDVRFANRKALPRLFGFEANRSAVPD